MFAWQPAWSCDQDCLYTFSFSLQPKISSYGILVQLTEWFLRKICFNILMGIDMSDLS